jgi:ABC-type antimicrobial peptide transport system permease subunit
MALGALGREVLLMIVGRALALAATGLAIGVFFAMTLGRVIRGQLFGVDLVDPITLATVALVLGGSALVASFLPAWRASRLDPGNALREG